MSLFNKKIGCVFLKETSDTQIFIEHMQELLKKASGDIRKEIEKQIKLATYGEAGERNVAFELKNSGMDMYVLHDIYLETEDLTAQIDYIVITRKYIYVLECKNLIGDIEIDNRGTFIRTYELFGKRKRESIYSPITQNEHHLQVLREIQKNSKNNFLTKIIFEKYFDENYKSLVVLANPKTCLNAKFAKKEIKQQVIRADQLIRHIKNYELNAKERNMSNEDMLKLAQFILKQNQSNKSDYAKKYKEIVEGMKLEDIDAKQEPLTTEEILIEKNEQGIDCNVEKDNQKEEYVKKLKAFRLKQSKSENIKPYYIFNDLQMADLIEKMPKNKEELLKVSGFGKVKVEKYGDMVLEILWGK